MTIGYRQSLTVALVAAVVNGVALSQTRGSAGALTLNGSLVTAGVAIFDAPRRVLVTTAANESGINFIITGTDRYGRVQSETLAGPNVSSAFTARDFLTVTGISVSGAMAGNATVGTNAVGSSQVLVLDTIANPTAIALASSVNSGTPTYTVEVGYRDIGPAYDFIANTIPWYPVAGFTALTANQDGDFGRPALFLRLTNNLGVGSVTLDVSQALKAGAF